MTHVYTPKWIHYYITTVYNDRSSLFLNVLNVWATYITESNSAAESG